MKCKKLLIPVLIGATLMGTISMESTASYAQDINIESELLLTKKKMELEIFSKDFHLLDIKEKAKIIKDYYKFHSKLYDIYSNQVNTESNSQTLYNLKEQLIFNEKDENKVNHIIYNAVKLYKENEVNLSDVEKEEVKNVIKETLLAQKEVRTKGRKLEDKIIAKMNLLNFNKIIGLERIANFYEKENNIEDAIDIYCKILELNNGDSSTIEKISELSIKNGKRPPLFVENKIVYLGDSMKKINNMNYIATKVLEKIDGFKVDWEGTTNNVIIKHRENIIKIPIGQDKIFLNDVVVDTGNYILLENEISYIPLRSLFEILSYTVSWNDKASAIVVSRTSYLKTEIDDLPIDELILNMFK